MSPFWRHIAGEITRATGERFSATAVNEVGGGCINRGCLLSGGDARYFVKTNHAGALEMFACEAEGLAELAHPGVLGVPKPVCYGAYDGRAFLAMEYIATGAPTAAGQVLLGEGLAALHQATKPNHGWHRDNFIGATPQPNAWTADWVEFLRDRRLNWQLKRAAQNGYGGALQSKGELLLEKLPAFFSDYTPKPSLLHGDLWRGNFAIAASGKPFIFDPAVYYGDRESDLAMSELFGGFARSFYAAYNTAAPTDAGYGARKHLYQLYHLLNHANLFGGAYAAQAERVMERLLAH